MSANQPSGSAERGRPVRCMPWLSVVFVMICGCSQTTPEIRKDQYRIVGQWCIACEGGQREKGPLLDDGTCPICERQVKVTWEQCKPARGRIELEPCDKCGCKREWLGDYCARCPVCDVRQFWPERRQNVPRITR